MVNVRMKDMFFDRAIVIRAMDRRTLSALKEFGRLVRKRAQASLKYAEGPSSPGSPPHAHRSTKVRRTSRSTGKVRTRTVSLLRDRLYFAYDMGSQSAVIGPERVAETLAHGAAPEALEYGGSSTVLDRGRERHVRIAARPFMGPALAAELPGLPKMFKDSVK
jgi:hypothetical protein